MRQEKSSLLRNKGFQSLLASLLCIVLGLLIGYIVLLIINPAGAGEAIRTIVENFLYYPSAAARLRYLGNTLVKTAPLLMCSLSAISLLNRPCPISFRTSFSRGVRISSRSK